jgi:hypothetical protein
MFQTGINCSLSSLRTPLAEPPMSLLQKPLVAGLLGFALGGPVWGVAGYVINDLTSKVDPVVAAEIKKAEATQKSLDDLFADSPTPAKPAAAPAAGSGSGSGSGL